MNNTQNSTAGTGCQQPLVRRLCWPIGDYPDLPRYGRKVVAEIAGVTISGHRRCSDYPDMQPHGLFQHEDGQQTSMERVTAWYSPNEKLTDGGPKTP